MVMGIGVPSASPTGNAAKKDKSRRKGASDEEDDAQNEEWVEPHSECQDDSGGSDSPRGRKRRKRRERDRDRRGRRGRSRGRDRERSRTPVRLPEVDRFIDENNINSEAAMKIRALSPESQRKVIARPLTGDVQNPSKVMIARVRELQNQNEKSKTGSGADFSLWSGAMLGAPPEAAIAKYIEENDLDDSAARSLRALLPHNQVDGRCAWKCPAFSNASAANVWHASSRGAWRCTGYVHNATTWTRPSRHGATYV
ncbi:unnamed protein product [Cladocopium goreaui]|uniref:PUB domain-containing protein n=1 Tax=Cladocopium goreaui TaxID=2562237 RepID=A0A9P1CL19_9DINO|nr:unnamed protein product [Cladocopium goreaui]